MGKSNAYHRDIYSGMVANALESEGYFGEEYRIYGFLLLENEEKRFYFTEWEKECAEQYLQFLYAGKCLTAYLSVGERIYESVNDGKEKAKQQIQRNLEKNLSLLQTITLDEKEELVRRQVIDRIIHLTQKETIVMPGEPCLSWKEYDKCFYGFVWRDKLDIQAIIIAMRFYQQL